MADVELLFAVGVAELVSFSVGMACVVTGIDKRKAACFHAAFSSVRDYARVFSSVSLNLVS